MYYITLPRQTLPANTHGAFPLPSPSSGAQRLWYWMLIAWQGAGGYPYPVGLSFNNQPLILPTPPSPTQQTQNTFVQRVPLFITQKPNDALTLQVYNLESNSQTIHPISWSYQDVAGHH